jgi:acetyl-CoA/propionyl-CoA carboxylase biotin carboxyl carrier protein
VGHAVEARIYAEDPSAGFLPTGGLIHALRLPEGVRVDSGVAEGSTVGSEYDPMLAKVIAWAPNREQALRGLDAALRDTVLLGIDTNIGFLRALLADPDVRAGRLDTGLIGRRIDALASADVPADVVPAAAVHALAELEPTGRVVDPFDVPGGWRVGAPAWTTWRMAVSGRDAVEVRVRGRAADAVVEVLAGEGVEAQAAVRASGQLNGDRLVVTLDGITRTYVVAKDGDTLWLGRDGLAWAVRERGPVDAVAAEAAGAGGPVRSPMPGTVTVVEVTEGQTVAAGDRLVVVEAMKMEHVLTAPVDGVVRDVAARAGAAVAKDAVLLTVETAENREH